MRIVRNLVKRNLHRDSVQLLHLSEEAKKIEGVGDAVIVMGTGTNKRLLRDLGLLTDEGAEASDSDMILAVSANSEELIEGAVKVIEEMLLKPIHAKGRVFYGLETALGALPDANFAVVSVPGEYARDLVIRLLDRGLHVHLFSDHVPIEQEVELKEYARERGLLVFGPGAGTSIINGIGIGFANTVNRGNIGIVAAAGTGLQEVSVLISQVGLGISQGLGVGGGDVRANVGGIMILESIKALEGDPETDIIAVVSKPPDPEVQERIVNHIANSTRKRYVLCFISPRAYRPPSETNGRIAQAKTLHAAALAAVKLADPGRYEDAIKRLSVSPEELLSITDRFSPQLAPEQRYVRALYTGGTLADEALLLLGEVVGDVWSNAPLQPRLKLADPYKSIAHSVIDLGGEEFTLGRAHPMIDPTVRKLRLIEEAEDPEVAVILMDFMLGYGSHPDPVGAMLGTIEEATKLAEVDGRYLPILGHVCGTELDPQNLSGQIDKLRSVGVTVFPTNALMAVAGAFIAARDKISQEMLNVIYRDFLTAS